MKAYELLFLLACFRAVAEGGRDGGWSDWSEWAPCTTTCGSGFHFRFRLCNDPPPSDGGNFCKGKPRDMQRCDGLKACPVDGGWTNWSFWTECSMTCGRGIRQRQRTCTQPIPQAGGKDCDGAPEQRETCTVNQNCPRDGEWSWWSGWSPCSVTCSEGTRQRLRVCNNPPPSGGGKPCRGLDNEIDGCFAGIECPVNGQWSTWTRWGRCPVTCGTAPIQRFRKCDDPPPQFGGLDCTGDSTETELCDPGIPCPVNGQWSLWSQWGPCSSANCRTKKDSMAYRIRSCNNPVPAHGGLMCQGEFLKAGLCRNPVNCPIDGKWSEWSEWTCADAIAKRTRQCDSPPPTNGGKPCPNLPEIEFYSREEHLELYRQVCGKNEPDYYEGEEEFDEKDV